MSGLLTTAAKAAIRRSEADVRTLVRIDLVTPSALTLRFGTSDEETPDGKHWQAGLEADPITDAVEFLGTGPNSVTWQFGLANSLIAGIVPPANLSALLATYQFRNARVRAYIWERSCTVWSDTPGAGDNLQFYDGIILSSTGGATKRTFTCSQPTAWDAMVPSKLVDKVNSPNAPDGALGLPYPIVVGSWKKPALVSPFGSGNIKDHDQSGGGRLAVPLIVTDPGQGAADVHATVACHSVKQAIGFTDGHSVFAEGDGRLLAPLDSAGVAQVLGAGESYVTVDDGQLEAYAFIQPSQVATAAPATALNSADNPRAAMTPFDLSAYALIDQNAGKNYLRLWLPHASQLGVIVGVEGIVAFVPTVNIPNPRVLRIAVCNLVTGTATVMFDSATALTAGTLYVVRGTWSGAYWDQQWDFSSNTQCGIQIAFDAGTTLAAKVYWCGLIVKYRPNRTIISNAKFVATPDHSNPLVKMRGPGGMFNITFDPGQYVPQVLQFTSSLWANVEGADDDGSGTFTGTIGALIERPADIVRWLLCHFGGLNATNDFETGAGALGSFVDARDAMRDGWGEAFTMAAYVGSQQKISNVMQSLMQQCLASAWLDRFTGLWRFVPWRSGALPDYDLTFTWENADITSVETTSVIDAAQEVRLRYGFDSRTGSELWESFLSPIGSSQGYSQPTWRDQQSVTITNANKYVEFQFVINFSGTVALGTYTNPIDLCKAVADAMNTAYGHPWQFACGWAFSIKSGYNDVLEFNVGGVLLTATLNAGTYTPDGLCYEVARALNAAQNTVVFSCAYSISTNLFTLSASGLWAIDSSVGATSIAPAWATLGFINGYHASAASRTANVTRYNDHYWINTTMNSYPDGTVLLWGSGAHAGSNCAAELGWQYADSAVGAAPLARGMREITSAAFLALNGARDPDSLTLDMVNDEATATRIRNRRFDLRTTERVIVTFNTLWAPDLRRLQAIQFDNSIDAHIRFPRYGSDGSWAGKVFRVLSVTQYPDAQMHQEVTAIEA